jgi:hypothetical protein
MTIERILCLLIALPGAAVLFYGTRLWKGEWNKGMFVYYTNQSNLLVVIFHALLFGAGFAPESGLYRFLSAAPVRLAVTCCITVTFWYTILFWYRTTAPKIPKISKNGSSPFRT